MLEDDERKKGQIGRQDAAYAVLQLTRKDDGRRDGAIGAKPKGRFAGGAEGQSVGHPVADVWKVGDDDERSRDFVEVGPEGIVPDGDEVRPFIEGDEIADGEVLLVEGFRIVRESSCGRNA